MADGDRPVVATEEFFTIAIGHALDLRDLADDLGALGFGSEHDAFDWPGVVDNILWLVAPDGSFSSQVVHDIARDWTGDPYDLWVVLSEVATGTRDPEEMLRYVGWTSDNTSPDVLAAVREGRYKIGGGWPADVGSDCVAWCPGMEAPEAEQAEPSSPRW